MPMSTTTETAAKLAESRAGKYLTFRLGREEFGIRVMQVREIMGLLEITPVPHTPAHVKGVINLRGKVIPVVCLRSKFSLSPAEYTARTSIIVVQVDGGKVLAGVIVDAVSEVLNVATGDIEDAPDFGSGAETSYLLGMAKIKGSIKILLDIDQVVMASELAALQSSTI
jgi:purine-binding chemotaxis protein CheW